MKHLHLLCNNFQSLRNALRNKQNTSQGGTISTGLDFLKNMRLQIDSKEPLLS